MSRNIPHFHFKQDFFKNFFSFCSNWIVESRQIYSKLRKFEFFLKSILNIRPYPNSRYNCFNIKGIKHLTRLRLGLTHLRYHKFKHGFLDSLTTTGSCGSDIETNCHSLLYCSNFIYERSLLLNNTSRLTKDKLSSCNTSVIKLFLYGDDLLDLVTNTLM